MNAALAGRGPCGVHHSGRSFLPRRLAAQRPPGCRLARRQQASPRTGPGSAAWQGTCWASASSAACSSSSSSSSSQQPDPLSSAPTWAKLLGAAAAVGVWYAVASAVRATSPFLSLSLALGSSSEGLRSAARSAWAGLAAGCLHTLAGADHLAALTPLTIGRSHFRASLMGALWGFGHSTGQLMLGLLMVVLKDRFQQLVPALSKWGGATVGLTLIAIGCMGIYETFFEQHHDDEEHGHGGPTASGEQEAAEFVLQDGVLVAKPKKKGFGSLATFATGIVYGLQPDALFVIVPALALPTKAAAVAYIVMFVLGTVAAMGGYTWCIGATSAALQRSNSGITKKLSGFAAFVAIAIGAVILSGGSISLPFGHAH